MAGEIPTRTFEHISVEELREFFKDRGVGAQCHSCGHEGNIAITDFNKNIPAISFTENPGPININLRMPIYITICNNCGFTASYNRFVFESWRSAKKEEGNKENG